MLPVLVFDNGRSGFLGEHSCMDGTPTLRMNEFMLASLAAGKVDLGPARTGTTGATLGAPIELTFELDARCHGYIDAACAHFDALVGKHEMEVLHYEGYGKEVMKEFKVSPDAWVQLVKQLAFQMMMGRPGVTYESCQTRKYQEGRTEVIRSASSESKAWAEAMLDPDVGDGERGRLFRAAVARHLQYAAWAGEGLGVDRHLFGLKRMLRAGEPTPGIYTDAGFARSNHWELSTSQLSSAYLDGWGYGEGKRAVSVGISANAVGSRPGRVWAVVLDWGGVCAVDDHVDAGGCGGAAALSGGGGDGDTGDAGAGGADEAVTDRGGDEVLHN